MKKLILVGTLLSSPLALASELPVAPKQKGPWGFSDNIRIRGLNGRYTFEEVYRLDCAKKLGRSLYTNPKNSKLKQYIHDHFYDKNRDIIEEAKAYANAQQDTTDKDPCKEPFDDEDIITGILLGILASWMEGKSPTQGAAKGGTAGAAGSWVKNFMKCAKGGPGMGRGGHGGHQVLKWL